MEPTKARRWNLQDLCLTTVVVSFLFAPAFKYGLDHDQGPVNLLENRRAADFPPPPATALDWAGWPRAFETWHDDHFGYRALLVRAHNALKIWVLHTSPSQRILVGRENWIYTTGADLDPWRGADPFAEPELEAWRRSLESRQRELGKQGIDYYCIVAPGKPEIYPEFLPARYHKGGPSRTDQLVAYLTKNSSFAVVDLRPALLEEKTRDVGDDYSYFPLGIHWTDRGAAAGTRAIVRELAKLHPEVSQVDQTIESLPIADIPGDTWAARLYLPDLLKQRVRQVRFEDKKDRPLSITRVDEERIVIVDQEDKSLPRALVFHDSFGAALPPILGRHFSHAVFVWKPDIDPALIEREKPDVLLQVLNERSIATLQPQEFHAADDTRAKDEFEASQEVALRFDVAANSPRIDPMAGGRVSVRGSGPSARVACETQNLADTFLLPAFPVRAGAHPIVRLEFESSVASSASILFQTRTDATYTRRRQLQYEIHIGLNELYVEIIDPEFAGRLLLRPAREVGTFLISALEARLVAN